MARKTHAVIKEKISMNKQPTKKASQEKEEEENEELTPALADD